MFKIPKPSLPNAFTPVGLSVQILRVEMPDKPTAIGLAELMLRQLGDQKYSLGNASTKIFRLRALMRDAGTKMIMVDKLQRIYDQESLKLTHHLADLLTTLAGATGATLVATGLPKRQPVNIHNAKLAQKLSIMVVQHDKD